MAVTTDRADRRIINRLQKGFPLSQTPFRDVGEELGVPEREVIQRLRRLLDDGALTRLAAILNAPQLGGQRTLAAVAAPEDRLEEVIEAINGHPEISHNYQRAHRFNLWFVISSEDPQAIERVIGRIEEETGLTVINVPTLEEFRVEFFYELPED
jgi:DNA-binding Lrp family transcriptional regulator